jgi:hypothetical protein
MKLMPYVHAKLDGDHKNLFNISFRLTEFKMELAFRILSALVATQFL